MHIVIIIIIIILVIGLPDAKVAEPFTGLTINNGFYTSKQFLPAVCGASKPGITLLIP